MSAVKNWLEKHRGQLSEIIIHVVAWGIFVAFYFLNNAFSQMSGWHKVFYVLYVLAFDATLFYFIYLIAIPRLLTNRKGWLFALILILLIGLLPFAQHVVVDMINGYFPQESSVMASISRAGFWQAYLIRVLSACFVVVMAGLGKFTFDWFRNLRIKTELENQNLTSELAFLKSQINPHFLFNTLNNIHTLAYKKSDLAPESIMKLSDLMRYMIYESDTDFVPLEKEVAHLKSFIDLQELRFKAKDVVCLDVNGNPDEFEIAPLLLLPFVENAFKHGTGLNRAGVIKIHLTSADGHIKFSVENESNQKIIKQKDERGGIGLENIKRRLALIYPDRHTLKVDQSSAQHSIHLTLW